MRFKNFLLYIWFFFLYGIFASLTWTRANIFYYTPVLSSFILPFWSISVLFIRSTLDFFHLEAVLLLLDVMMSNRYSTKIYVQWLKMHICSCIWIVDVLFKCILKTAIHGNICITPHINLRCQYQPKGCRHWSIGLIWGVSFCLILFSIYFQVSLQINFVFYIVSTVLPIWQTHWNRWHK